MLASAHSAAGSTLKDMIEIAHVAAAALMRDRFEETVWALLFSDLGRWKRQLLRQPLGGLVAHTLSAFALSNQQAGLRIEETARPFG